MANEEGVEAGSSSYMTLTIVKDQKVNQKAEERMGYAQMRMRNNRSKIRWDLAGHVSPKFKPGKKQEFGYKDGTAQGKIRADWEWVEKDQ